MWRIFAIMNFFLGSLGFTVASFVCTVYIHPYFFYFIMMIITVVRAVFNESRIHYKMSICGCHEKSTFFCGNKNWFVNLMVEEREEKVSEFLITATVMNELWKMMQTRMGMRINVQMHCDVYCPISTRVNGRLLPWKKQNKIFQPNYFCDVHT